MRRKRFIFANKKAVVAVLSARSYTDGGTLYPISEVPGRRRREGGALSDLARLPFPIQSEVSAPDRERLAPYFTALWGMGRKDRLRSFFLDVPRKNNQTHLNGIQRSRSSWMVHARPSRATVADFNDETNDLGFGGLGPGRGQ